MRRYLEPFIFVLLLLGFLVALVYRWIHLLGLPPKTPGLWPHFILGTAYDLMAAGLVALVAGLLSFVLPLRFYPGLLVSCCFLYLGGLHLDYQYLVQFGSHLPFSSVEYLTQLENFGSSAWDMVKSPYLYLLVFLPTFLFWGLFRLGDQKPPTVKARWISLGGIILLSGPAGTYANGYLSKNLNDPLISTGLHYFYWSKTHLEKPIHWAEPKESWPLIHKDLLGEPLAFSETYPLARLRRPDGCQKPQTPLAKNLCGKQRPNILFLFLESFRAAEIGALGGPKNLTPEFDQWAKKGVFYTHFMANGFQTRHGQFAAYCGIMPNYGPPVMRDYFRQSYRCLPQILKEAGYETQWVTSADRSFDNQGEFLKKIGFQKIKDRYDFPSGAEELGWGYSDQALFDFWLRELDQLKEPFFSSAITITNHHPFEAPEQYHQPTGQGDWKFHNTMRYTSAMTAHFLEEAEKKPWWNHTLIFIFADTSNFQKPLTEPSDLKEFITLRSRIPLLITGGLVKTPQKQTHFASQIDLAPTIMDILGAPYQAPFTGQSLLQEKSRAFTNRPGIYWAYWSQKGELYVEAGGRKEAVGMEEKTAQQAEATGLAWLRGIRWLLQEDRIWPAPTASKAN